MTLVPFISLLSHEIERLERTTGQPAGETIGGTWHHWRASKSLEAWPAMVKETKGLHKNRSVYPLGGWPHPRALDVTNVAIVLPAACHAGCRIGW
jgi:hypothetical protein